LKCFQERLFEVQPKRILLIAAVHEGNERSENVLGKCGFAKVGGIPFVGGRSLTVGEERELGVALVKGRELRASGSGGKVDVQSSSGEQPEFSWYCFENPKMA
jgi:hypothetical protein